MEQKTHQEQMQEQMEQIQKTLAEIKTVFVVMSGKGGVGKSTVAANLAVGLAAKGAKVGLLDIDIHGPNIPKMLGLEDQVVRGSEQGMLPVKLGDNLSVISMALMPGLGDSAVIWRGPLKMGVIRQFLSEVAWGSLDYLVVDLPPGTGDEPLTISQLLAGRAQAVIVTTPQDVSLQDVRKSINFVQQLAMPVAGIIENMSGFACPHCGEEVELFKAGGGEGLAGEADLPFLGRLPFELEVVAAGDAGTPMVLLENSKTGKAFRVVVDKLTSSS